MNPYPNRNVTASCVDVCQIYSIFVLRLLFFLLAFSTRYWIHLAVLNKMVTHDFRRAIAKRFIAINWKANAINSFEKPFDLSLYIYIFFLYDLFLVEASLALLLLGKCKKKKIWEKSRSVSVCACMLHFLVRLIRSHHWIRFRRICARRQMANKSVQFFSEKNHGKCLEKEREKNFKKNITEKCTDSWNVAKSELFTLEVGKVETLKQTTNVGREIVII